LKVAFLKHHDPYPNSMEQQPVCHGVKSSEI
jgi:hypothetical protein